ncbi:MAG: cupredoxin family copper-binding protein [Chloroflexota bacterium]
MVHRILVLSGLALLLTAVSCAAGIPVSSPTPKPASAQAPSPQPTSVSVAISGFAFIPPSVEIPTGTRVTWTNNDSVVHTVTSNDKTFDSGNMSKNAAFSFVFTSPGTYEYYCIPHPYMKGRVIVK